MFYIIYILFRLFVFVFVVGRGLSVVFMYISSLVILAAQCIPYYCMVYPIIARPFKDLVLLFHSPSFSYIGGTDQVPYSVGGT